MTTEEAQALINELSDLVAEAETQVDVVASALGRAQRRLYEVECRLRGIEP